jgi:two-component system, OmpR family, phosphate regulon sensor histidine kinase PhoR
MTVPMPFTAYADLLHYQETPAILVTGQRVYSANPAAISLLGGHIVGQDVRIAIRNPAAVAVIASENGGSADVTGLSVPGSVWRVACHVLNNGARLVMLEDQSVQASVARAHADFVANASHELRTPLAAILGYVETLEDPKAGNDAETRNRFLSIIKREAGRMSALVEDLMSLSRIEAGKHEAPRDQIDLVAIARHTASETSGNEVVSVDANAETAMIAGDPGQIAQVLRNLLENALKYGKPGGPINIRIEASKTGWVSVAIRDEGEGIPPEHLPRLTERFYRVDESRSRRVGGTGLGLSIVKHIVERHRGRFDISSRPGEGTTATVMLPIAED